MSLLFARYVLINHFKDQPNPSHYAAKSDVHNDTTAVPSQFDSKDVPREAGHSGYTTEKSHDLKKAQNALHEGLQPAEDSRNNMSSYESGPRNASTWGQISLAIVSRFVSGKDIKS